MLDARTLNNRRDTAARRLGGCTARLVEVNARMKALRRVRQGRAVARWVGRLFGPTAKRMTGSLPIMGVDTRCGALQRVRTC